MLIKPGRSLHRPRGDLQPRGREQIAQEVKTPADATDERLVACCSTLSSANVSFTRRIAARDFQPVGARTAQSSKIRLYASPIAAMRSSRNFE